MNLKKSVLLFVLTLTMPLVLAQCGEEENGGTNPEGPDCTIESDQPFELLYPTSSDTFHVGDTVQIEYKVDADRISGILISVTMEMGVVKKGLNTGGQIPIPEGDGTYRCGTYQWIIGEEAQFVDYKATNDASLYFEEYTDPNLNTYFSDMSFTILNP